MGMISVKHKGNFNKAEKFFNRVLRKDYLNILDQYGRRGVEILREATPKDTGETAASWNYEISEGNGLVTIAWTNSKQVNGECIVFLIVYGHGMQNGGYVEGNQFVNPAIRPVLREMSKKAWREVTK